MQNISSIRNCYGCGVCAAICPRGIIALELDKNGFYRPRIIALEKCTDCKLCLSVCAYTHDEPDCKKTVPVNAYAAWSNDVQIRRKCSSGGIAFELGRQLIETGYKACGVRYNAEAERAEHYVAATVEEFIPAIGSKYIQSYTVDAFSQFDGKTKYFVTGTPCQIDSLRRFFRLKKMDDRVVLMDFFCHGVPSMLLWKKYLKQIEKIIGKTTHVSWRSKRTGWHDSWAMEMSGKTDGKTEHGDESAGKTSYSSRWSQGDLFYKMFLNDSCLGKACYEKCKYKALSSSADIRAGDFWGASYRHDDKGVSCVLVFTEKGLQIIKAIENSVMLIPQKTTVVLEGQMKSPPVKPRTYQLINLLLKSKLKLNTICKLCWFVYKIRSATNRKH